MPPPAPAVYRESGGVPIPPNLRPSERDCAGLRRTRHTMQRHGTIGVPVGASAYARAKESAVASTTYTLPDLPWAVLLEPILHQAPPGATIIVYTAAMRAHVEQAVRAADREDLLVCQQDAPPAAGWH